MPSFIGRVAASRLASSAAATSSSRLVIAKQLGRVSCPLQSSLPLLRAGFVRAYATPGRPKKTDTISSTQSAGRPRKTAAAGTTKAPAKKAAATKTKAATATKSAKPKKAKPVSKPKKKKELTEAQLAKKELMKVRLEKAELKKKALFTEPKPLASNPWMLYVTRKSTGNPVVGSFADKMNTLAEEFRSLSHSEKEVIYKTHELQRASEENKLKNAASYKAWVESHKPEVIAEAQNARNLLKRKYGFPKANGQRKIQDDRQPKLPRSSWIFFFRARHGSGDFNSLTQPEALKSIAQEWKSLPTVDRQPFADLAAADLARYKKQVEETLHREVSPAR
ncbi:hypothetical protein PG985_007014 [Apiospora marii]|uniref:HMG box domain-containing protein n=1 Tax=Apiospora marii TaxID=335849 RepID=A0ABR1SFA0_9PEZI